MDVLRSFIQGWETLVLAGGLAIGVYIIIMAFARVGLKPTGEQRLKKPKETEKEAGAVIPNPQSGVREFTQAWRARGLKRAIKQADLELW